MNWKIMGEEEMFKRKTGLFGEEYYPITGLLNVETGEVRLFSSRIIRKIGLKNSVNLVIKGKEK